MLSELYFKRGSYLNSKISNCSNTKFYYEKFVFFQDYRMCKMKYFCKNILKGTKQSNNRILITGYLDESITPLRLSCCR